MSHYPDDFNSAAFARHMGEGPRYEAYALALESEYDYLLDQLTDELTTPGKVLTKAQAAISQMIGEEELDGAIFAGIIAAAKHLKNRKSITPEQVGRILIAALDEDLRAIAERHAADAE